MEDVFDAPGAGVDVEAIVTLPEVEETSGGHGDDVALLVEADAMKIAGGDEHVIPVALAIVVFEVREGVFDGGPGFGQEGGFIVEAVVPEDGEASAGGKDTVDFAQGEGRVGPVESLGGDGPTLGMIGKRERFEAAGEPVNCLGGRRRGRGDGLAEIAHFFVGFDGCDAQIAVGQLAGEDAGASTDVHNWIIGMCLRVEQQVID